MKIVDSHIHFWDPAHLRYRWLDDLPTLNTPHLPSALPSSGDGWELNQLVFVQAECLPEQGLDEVEWVTELADQELWIKGIVAFAPLENHNFHAYLEILRDNPMVKGVRRLIQSEEAGFATQEHFIDAVCLLPDYEMSFDICVFHHQLPDAITLVKACPNVPFILDHLGKPPIKTGEMDEWAKNIKTLAAFENVHCKVSGMVTEANPANLTTAALQPYVDVVLASFGVKRLMFGSDHPVMKLANTDYASWVQTALNLFDGLSDDEKQAIFFDNASQFYRLG